MRYDAVIFDLFGTLVPLPSVHEETEALGAVATTLGLEREWFLTYWREHLPDREAGKLGSLADNLQHACRTLGASPTQNQIAHAVENKERQVRRYLSAPSDGLSALRAVRSTGTPIGLISNGPPETSGVWPSVALAQLVDHPVFSAAVGMTKPAPAIYLHACSLLGVSPKRCLYVGDGGSRELTGATRVGMEAVLVRGSSADGGFYADQIDDAHDWPGPVIATVAEVAGMLEG